MAQEDADLDVYIRASSERTDEPSGNTDQLESDPRISKGDHDDMASMKGIEELIRLMRTQTELTERLLAKAEEKTDDVGAAPPPSSSVDKDYPREILDVLRRIDERQTASGT